MNEIERVYILFSLRKWWGNKYCCGCYYLIVMCCAIISCWNIMLEEHAAGIMIQLLICWSSFQSLNYSLPFRIDTSGWEWYIIEKWRFFAFFFFFLNFKIWDESLLVFFFRSKTEDILFLHILRISTKNLYFKEN